MAQDIEMNIVRGFGFAYSHPLCQTELIMWCMQAVVSRFGEKCTKTSPEVRNSWVTRQTAIQTLIDKLEP